jgi:ketosteroid isomerase-like protein
VATSAILAAVMSEESTTPDLVEILRRAFGAANRRDLDSVANSFAEDATFDGRGVGGPFEGRAAIRGMLDEWFAAYEELEFGLEEPRDLGNGVVFAVVVQNGRPAGTAGHLRQREGWVFVLVRGLIARLTTSEVDEARAAAERLAEGSRAWRA